MQNITAEGSTTALNNERKGQFFLNTNISANQVNALFAFTDTVRETIA